MANLSKLNTPAPTVIMPMTSSPPAATPSTLVDADTGGPMTKSTTNAVSEREYSRMLAEGPALKELAKRDAYLNAHESEGRTSDEKIYQLLDKKRQWPPRYSPTLKSFKDR